MAGSVASRQGRASAPRGGGMWPPTGLAQLYPSPFRQTPNAKRQTPNANAKRRTPNAKRYLLGLSCRCRLQRTQLRKIAVNALITIELKVKMLVFQPQ